MHNKQVVIAIAGTAASGKSTIAEALVKKFEDACLLKFDDYFNFLVGWPKDLREWLNKDGDFNDFKNPQMLNDIAKLLNNKHIIYPETHETIHPTKFILVEDPIGRERKDFAKYYDYLLYLSIPNEISLTRIINRMLKNEIVKDNSKIKLRNEKPKKLLKIIFTFTQNYIAFYRDLYEYTGKQVRKKADLILDGLKSPNDLVLDILAFLEEKNLKEE